MLVVKLAKQPLSYLRFEFRPNGMMFGNYYFLNLHDVHISLHHIISYMQYVNTQEEATFDLHKMELRG